MKAELFKWVVAIIITGYLFVFYQYVVAYKSYVDEFKMKDRFQLDNGDVFDTKTGALYETDSQRTIPYKMNLYYEPIIEEQ